ncbi:unnamed protein product [Rotaria sp. Silwood1]|nr:unnamed protein product [Rotaria sp. Silwood1]
MDRINVQRWANSLRQFHRKHFQPQIGTNVCIDNQNGFRNASTTVKTKENESPKDNSKYSLTLEFPSPKKDSCHKLIKSQLYTSDMTTKDEENLNYSSDVQLCDNHTSDFVIPSSDHHDIDTLSDAGTYIIEDDNELEQKNNSSLAYKRYVCQTKNRHGTFDIHQLITSTTQTINRPIIDLNISKNDLVSSSSSSSSIVSFSNENDHNIHNELENQSSNDTSNILLQSPSQNQIKPAEYFVSSSSSSSSHVSFSNENDHNIYNELENQSSNDTSNILLQSSSQNQIKPAEYFVISPTLKTKHFLNTDIHQRKTDILRQSEKSVPIKDSNVKTAINQSISPSLSSCSNQNSVEKYSFYLEKQLPYIEPSIQSHTITNDQTNSSELFQRNSIIGQTISSSSIINNNDYDETKPNFTKFSMNKTFLLRQQSSNHLPSTSKLIQQQISSKTLSQQISKPTTTINSCRQINRTVQLRRARAQAKIEELSQRNIKQLNQNDIMNTSWHSNASSNDKKELANLQLNSPIIARTNIISPRQDILARRTISSISAHRPTSTSPKFHEEISPRCRKTMTSIEYQKRNTSACNIEEKRCDILRENGQRLVIKLIQISSGILEKLKPHESVIDDDINVRELEQLVDKLEMVNRTLTSIDASFTDPFV